MSDELPQVSSAHELYNDPKVSMFKKYRYLTTGSFNIASWIKYEIITGLFTSLPGALGYFLRKFFFPRLLHQCGRGVTFGKGVTLRGVAHVKIGKNVYIGDNCVIDAKGSKVWIEIQDNVFIGRNTMLRARDAELTIESGTNIGVNCVIGTANRLRIGKDTLIAAYCYLMGGGGHRFDRTDIPIIKQGVVSKGGVTVGDNCWLGARVTVLDGVEVGRDTIVGAGAVVTRSLPDYCIAVGMPAQVLRMRKE